jgi:hypothetical protein
MTAEASNQIFLRAYVLGVAPGRIVLALIGLEASITTTHTVGWHFVQQLVLQSIANWIAWAMIFFVILMLINLVSSDRSRRLRPNTGSGVGDAPGEKKWFPWKSILTAGFVLGGLLPISTLGVVILATEGTVDVLWNQPAPGMRFVQTLLAPGKMLLLFGESHLHLGSEYASQKAFWRSYAAHLVANWGAWTMIAFIFRLAWLRWFRDAMEALERKWSNS